MVLAYFYADVRSLTMETHSSRPWPLADSSIVPQRVSWPRSSMSSMDSECARYRDEFRRLYDSTSEDVYRLPLPDIEIALPARQQTPIHSSSRVGSEHILDEGRSSCNSKLPEQGDEIHAPQDPKLVRCEGIYDPAHPRNWPSWTKTINIAGILMMCVTQ